MPHPDSPFTHPDPPQNGIWSQSNVKRAWIVKSCLQIWKALIGVDSNRSLIVYTYLLYTGLISHSLSSPVFSAATTVLASNKFKDQFFPTIVQLRQFLHAARLILNHAHIDSLKFFISHPFLSEEKTAWTPQRSLQR